MRYAVVSIEQKTGMPLRITKFCCFHVQSRHAFLCLIAKQSDSLQTDMRRSLKPAWIAVGMSGRALLTMCPKSMTVPVHNSLTSESWDPCWSDATMLCLGFETRQVVRIESFQD